MKMTNNQTQRGLMRMRVSLTSTWVLFLLFPYLNSMFPDPLPKILHNLEKGRSTELEKNQNLALAIIVNNPTLSWKLINCFIDILLITERKHKTTSRFAFIADHIDHIDQAIKTFKNIPGFRPILIHVLTHNHLPHMPIARWFQLVVALKIANTQIEETVQAFGRPPECEQHIPKCLLYNIITSKRWLACKTIHWTSIPFDRPFKITKRLKKTLLRQKNIVEQYNSIHATSLSYEIYSQQPVTQGWHDWLHEQLIPYHELQEI